MNAPPDASPLSTPDAAASHMIERGQVADSSPQTPTNPPKPSDLPGVEMIGNWLRVLEIRSTIFGSRIPAEPAWDILLYLYSAFARGEVTQITGLAPMIGLPSSTTGRWARHLIGAGMVERWRDPADGRRWFVRISPEGIFLMAAFIGRIEADPRLRQRATGR